MLFHVKPIRPPVKKKYANKSHQIRYDKGLCITCGKTAPRPGNSGCESCLTRAKRQAKVRDHDRRDRGVCTRCQGARDGETSVCSACRLKIIEIQNRSYHKRRYNGACTDCGKPLGEFRYVHCEDCRARRRAHYRKWYHGTNKMQDK